MDLAPVWSWLALGGVLLIVEAFAPGFMFLWLGLAAGLVGVVLLAAPGLAWQYQLLLFAAFSVASIALWLAFRRRRPPTSDRPDLNLRAAQHLGRIYVVSEPIRNGRGRVRVGDGSWSVKGPDAPVGARMRVVGAEGTVLVVEPEAAEDGGAPP